MLNLGHTGPPVILYGKDTQIANHTHVSRSSRGDCEGKKSRETRNHTFWVGSF